jgi:hypothetical protein
MPRVLFNQSRLKIKQLILLAIIVLFVWSPTVKSEKSPSSSSIKPALAFDSNSSGQIELPELLMGSDLSRKIAGGEVHSYKVSLEAKQFFNVIVEQQGADVVVTLYGPDGKQLVEADNQLADYEPERVLLIAETTGDYRLGIRTYGKDTAPGQYRLKVAELRAATARDVELVKAHEQYDEVLRL